MSKFKVSKKALAKAREAKELSLAGTMVEEEYASVESQMAAKKSVKEEVKELLQHPQADDKLYWVAPLGQSGMKQVRKALTSLILDGVDEEWDGIDWNKVPRLETDAEENYEGIQPSFFLALMMGEDKTSIKEGLQLVQTLASNKALRKSQGWVDGEGCTSWYKVANAALMMVEHPKLLASLAAGWIPPKDSSDPSEWMKSLKAYATAIAAAAE